jgi:type IV secretion system protein VirB10
MRTSSSRAETLRRFAYCTFSIALNGVLLGGPVLGGAAALAQTTPATAPENTPVQQAETPQAATPQTVNPQTVDIPAGTRVLLSLRSGVNTKSAQPGDGVYLSSTFPVIVGSRVVIPAGVYVQGVIDRVQRAGRIKGRAEVGMHFTTMIFPNGSVVSIPGVLNSVPGSNDAKVKNNEGDVQANGSKGKDAATIARQAETGASIGAIGGAIGGSPLAGAGYGAAAGGAAGLIYTLLTRGNDVNLEQGQTVEMVLQRPLTLQPANLAGGPAAGSALVPTAQAPMRKPDRQRMLCPVGGLGCP